MQEVVRGEIKKWLGIGIILFLAFTVFVGLNAERNLKIKTTELLYTVLERSLNERLFSSPEYKTVNRIQAIDFIGRGINERLDNLRIKNQPWFKSVEIKICQIDGVILKNDLACNIPRSISLLRNDIERDISYYLEPKLNVFSIGLHLLLVLLCCGIVNLVTPKWTAKMQSM